MIGRRVGHGRTLVASPGPTVGVELLPCAPCTRADVVVPAWLLPHYSRTGNFGFGIDEHIDLGIKYDPSTGIYGMDFYICLTRAGRRVSRRKAKTGRLGKPHKVNKNDSIAWFEKTFDGIVSGKRRDPTDKSAK